MYESAKLQMITIQDRRRSHDSLFGQQLLEREREMSSEWMHVPGIHDLEKLSEVHFCFHRKIATYKNHYDNISHVSRIN